MGMNYRIVAKTLYHFEKGEIVAANVLEGYGVDIDRNIYLGNLVPVAEYDSPKKRRPNSPESE